MKSMVIKILSWLSVLALTVSGLPMLSALSVAAEEISEGATANITVAADPVTMDDWRLYFGDQVMSTQNAGGVWTDKSVMTDASAFADVGITLRDENGLLVALSAIASTTSISGLTNLPTDTIFVLELSQRRVDELSSLVSSVNRTIAALQTMNRYHRVGVVAYSDDATVLLPLGRYNGDVYLEMTDAPVSVKTVSGLTNSDGQAMAASCDVADEAFAQAGLLSAMEEMLSVDTVIPEDAAFLAGVSRLPVIVWSADGDPTAAAPQYTVLTDAVVHDSAYNAAPMHFMTRLTAAYAKERIDAHYADNAPIWYTVSAASADTLDPVTSERDAETVLNDPSVCTQEQIDRAVNARTVEGYWTMLMNDGAVDVTVHDADGHHVTHTIAVSAIGDQATFPSRNDQRRYVDEALVDDETAWDMISETLSLRSHYHPTLVDDGADVSGYVAFVDKIGPYMHVTDIKGIVIDDTLYSGAWLSKNFVTGGGDLGTYHDPKPLGDELVWAVQARIGVDADAARDLLGLAYAHGQLFYIDDDHFSNYIGWYANADGEYLGFWYDGITSMPDPQDPSLSDKERPAYIMKSYGFLGAVDERHGVSPSDLMYTTVQHRRDILTGEEMVSFAIPASLIPMVSYDVTLDDRDCPIDLQLSGADSPIRLVYEVSLDDAIDGVTVTELDGYTLRGDDGSYRFYSNQFETDDRTGYGAVNTYSYFVPSRANAQYYYTENSTVYADTRGTVYVGELDPNGVYYRADNVYVQHDAFESIVVYEKISATSLACAVGNADGTWYIPAGTVRTMLDDYIVTKEDNVTESLSFVNMPFVDARYTYYVGATLGNNGMVSVMPEHGIRLSASIKETNAPMSFTVTRIDAAENESYRAVMIDENGYTSEQTVVFRSGQATVSLTDGDVLYIVGLAEGATYRVEENDNADVLFEATDMVVTVNAGSFAQAAFVGALKGTGNVTVTNRVTHDFGLSYPVPDKTFTFCADLGREYAFETVTASHSDDTSLTSVTADQDGCVTFTLRHTEQFELFGLKEGTVVTVTERMAPDGFTPTYYADNVKDRSSVVIRKDAASAVVVMNDYATEPITADITLRGDKTLVGRADDAWLETDVFTFELQRHNGTAWETIASQTVDTHHRSFDFSQIMRAETYAVPGYYSYQVLESDGDVQGIVYDHHIHTFSVIVGDPDMTGLRVTDIVSHEDTDIIDGNAQDGWTVTTHFENRCSDNETTAVIDIVKEIRNDADSDIATKAGFRFGLFENGSETPSHLSPFTDMLGETRMVMVFDAAGTYTYELREIVPDVAEPGIRFSSDAYTVVVTVSACDAGSLDAVTAILKNSEPHSGALTFVNEYVLAPAQLNLDVTVALDGRPLRDEEFTVFVKNGDDVLATGQNASDGGVVFDAPLIFTAVGDYYYDVVQEQQTAMGITCDAMSYRLHIRVTDGGDGTLQAYCHVVNAADDTVTFRNRYQPTPVSLTLQGETCLVGRQLVNEEFHFLLIETSGGGELMLSAANRTDGVFAFEPIMYDTAGIYSYSVQEIQNSTTHGLVFDKTQYTVTVTVTDDGNGQLSASYTLSKQDEAATELLFENVYQPAPVTIPLGGVKTDADGEEYRFTLYRADDDWGNLSEQQTVHSLEDGTFSFDPLTLTTGGTYRYIIREQDGTKQYYVLITAADNHRGNLDVDVTVLDHTKRFCLAMTFDAPQQPVPPTTESTTTTTTTTTTLSSDTAVTTTGTVPKAPQTGESSSGGWWSAWMLLSGAALAVLFRFRRNTVKIH